MYSAYCCHYCCGFSSVPSNFTGAMAGNLLNRCCRGDTTYEHSSSPAYHYEKNTRYQVTYEYTGYLLQDNAPPGDMPLVYGFPSQICPKQGEAHRTNNGGFGMMLPRSVHTSGRIRSAFALSALSRKSAWKLSYVAGTRTKTQ